MAKYCGNCGAQLEDDAKVCGQCGTFLEGKKVKVPGIKVTDPQKKKKYKRMVRFLITFVIIFAISLMAYKVVPKYIGYNGLLRKVMIAYEKYDIDTLASLSSDMYYYGEKDWLEYYFESTVGQSLDFFDSNVGHTYDFSYKVNDTYEMSKRKTDKMLEEIEELYEDFDVNTIKKIVVADITITAKKEQNSADIDKSIIMSKENGKWKVLYIE